MKSSCVISELIALCLIWGDLLLCVINIPVGKWRDTQRRGRERWRSHLNYSSCVLERVQSSDEGLEPWGGGLSGMHLFPQIEEKWLSIVWYITHWQVRKSQSDYVITVLVAEKKNDSHTHTAGFGELWLLGQSSYVHKEKPPSARSLVCHRETPSSLVLGMWKWWGVQAVSAKPWHGLDF